MNPEKLARIKPMGAVAYTTEAGIVNTYESVEKIVADGIEGDFIECGVAAGTQIGVMGAACQDLSIMDRTIWAFDSYEGIPMASENDSSQPAIEVFKEPKPFVEDKETLLVSSGVSSHSKKDVIYNLNNWGVNIAQYRFVEGWFQHTLPTEINNIEKVALLRLDGDLYESTKVCLEYLFPKVVKGGIVIIDDYGLSGCKKACDDYLENQHVSELYAVTHDGEADYGAKWLVKE